MVIIIVVMRVGGDSVSCLALVVMVEIWYYVDNYFSDDGGEWQRAWFGKSGDVVVILVIIQKLEL